jgi:hypothetical protein
MKKCIACGIEKDLSLFHKAGFESDGRQKYRSRCSDCIKPVTKNRYHSNKEHLRKTVRNHQLKAMYGITADDYEKMKEEQRDKCFLCGGKDKKRLSVDHCHDTGRVRKLLCSSCNFALGLFRDNPELLRKAADYVERY